MESVCQIKDFLLVELKTVRLIQPFPLIMLYVRLAVKYKTQILPLSSLTINVFLLDDHETFFSSKY